MRKGSFSRRRANLRLEHLERRDAPATLVNPTKLTYQDVDGDNVTVTLSKPIPPAVNPNNVFMFDTGSVDGKNAIKQQLQTIDVSAIGATADGTSINVTATHGAKTVSDGLVNVGAIIAKGLNLGPVTVAGDLGRILAGDADPTLPALKSLNVRSMGRYGLDTQAPGGSLASEVAGALGSLTVKGDMIGVHFFVNNFADAKVGFVSIGGSLVGASADQSGRIDASGDVGPVRIGGDLVGGDGDASGGLQCGGKLASVSIGGSMLGGAGWYSGTIDDYGGGIGTITITHNFEGGSGYGSGRILSSGGSKDGTIAAPVPGGGKIGAITIGGSIIAGEGSNVNAIVVSGGDMGPVRIGHDLVGGKWGVSGQINCYGNLSSVTIGGSITGGDGEQSAWVHSAGDMGPVTIGHDLLGGAGAHSGAIESEGKLASLRVGGSIVAGSIVGGTNSNSGFVTSAGDMGAVRIGADLKGGSGADSGSVESTGNLASVTIGGSIVGGSGANSGRIDAGRDVGAMHIGRDLLGGAGSSSGSIAGGKLASLSIGGSLVGDTGDFSGDIDASTVGVISIAGNIVSGGGFGSGRISSRGKGDAGSIASVRIGGSIIDAGGNDYSACIIADGDMGPVRIGHDLVGGGGNFSGRIASRGKLASVTIGGSVIGGSMTESGRIYSGGDMGAVRIARDLKGGAGDNSGQVETDGNLASVSIGGSIIGGSGSTAGAVTCATPNSQMGTVTIGHDLLGGSNSMSGTVLAGGNLAGISIGGSLIGGLGPSTGAILGVGDIGAVRIGHDFTGASIALISPPVVGSGLIASSEGRIASIKIGGSIISGVDAAEKGFLTNNATIRAADDIGSLTVTGSIIGNSNPNGNSPVIISARGRHTVPPGATSDLAIGRISVGGRVEYVQFLAGYDTNLTPVNADAQIGPVTVGKDWVASDLVAGVEDAAQNGFGNSDDGKISGTDSAGIVSKIASITIGGVALGTPISVNAADHYGFVAQQIGSLRVNGFNIPLNPGPENDLLGIPVGVTGDLDPLEVARVLP